MYKPLIQAFMIITLVLSTGSLYAGDTAILDIKPPTSNAATASNAPIGNFDGSGTLQRIEAAKVVIGDSLYRLKTGVAYRNHDGSLSTAAAFPVGIRVWFVLKGDDNTIESLWKEGG